MTKTAIAATLALGAAGRGRHAAQRHAIHSNTRSRSADDSAVTVWNQDLEPREVSKVNQ